MKKFTKVTLIVSICLISMGIIFSVVGLAGNANWRKAVTGGMWDTTLFVSDDYDNEFREDGIYHAPARDVDAMEIDWYYGDISIEVYGGKDVLIRETSGETLEKDTALKYKTEDGVLKISALADAAEVRFSADNPSANAEKELTVKIPKNFVSNLKSVEIDTISSDIQIGSLDLAELALSSENGDFISRGLKAETADIDLGEGTMRADFLTCPRELSFYADRGDCLLGLPENSRANCSYYARAGQVYSGFGNGRGKHDGNGPGDGNGRGRRIRQGEMQLGNGGRNNFDLYTGSGDIRLCRGTCFQ